jgi:hypothetical protein
MAGFIAALVARPSPLPERLTYRILAWIACGLLLTMHLPVAIAGRVLTARVLTAGAIEAIASGSSDMRSSINRDRSPDVEDRNVIFVTQADETARMSLPPSRLPVQLQQPKAFADPLAVAARS